jgi:protein PET100
MGGPNLELFRFAFYVFFPVAMLVHYGDPDWYSRHVLPVRIRDTPLERFVDTMTSFANASFLRLRKHTRHVLFSSYLNKTAEVVFQHFPADHSALQQELARIKSEKLARKSERERDQSSIKQNEPERLV